MKTSEAVRLIERTIPAGATTWADIGAGEGTFTRALVQLLGPKTRIYAVDRDADALARLARWAARETAKITPVQADFALAFDLPGLDRGTLDGILLANALHFVHDAAAVLARLATWLLPGGRVVFVEYDRRAASRWVPYPISAEQLPALASSAGLSSPIVVTRRPSAFGGDLYVATADRTSPSASDAR